MGPWANWLPLCSPKVVKRWLNVPMLDAWLQAQEWLHAIQHTMWEHFQKMTKQTNNRSDSESYSDHFRGQIVVIVCGQPIMGLWHEEDDFIKSSDVYPLQSARRWYWHHRLMYFHIQFQPSKLTWTPATLMIDANWNDILVHRVKARALTACLCHHVTGNLQVYLWDPLRYSIGPKTHH